MKLLTVRTCQSLKRRRPGFSLLEILIVIGLIGAIAAAVLGALGGQDEGARARLAEIFVTQTIRSPLQTFRLNVGRYPTTAEGLDALVEAPGEAGSRWRGPYIEAQNLSDPWGNPYQYAYPGQHNTGKPDVWSLGPDGKESSGDEVTNW